MMRGILFLIAGLALLLGAGISGSGVLRLIRAGAIASGEVVRLNAGGSHPQVTFTTADGQRISYSQNGLVFGARAGDIVRVRYDPRDPAGSATLDRVLVLWSVPLFLALLGGGFVAAGGSVLAGLQPGGG